VEESVGPRADPPTAPGAEADSSARTGDPTHTPAPEVPTRPQREAGRAPAAPHDVSFAEVSLFPMRVLAAIGLAAAVVVLVTCFLPWHRFAHVGFASCDRPPEPSSDAWQTCSGYRVAWQATSFVPILLMAYLLATQARLCWRPPRGLPGGGWTVALLCAIGAALVIPVWSFYLHVHLFACRESLAAEPIFFMSGGFLTLMLVCELWVHRKAVRLRRARL
jgi:magnesium-transporting ATPase (P-type)